jgi:nicotinic acid mononucleotide adenylyltransferase
MADKKPTPKEHAVAVFGRFNPVTTGHAKLIQHVKSLAKHHGADHYVFASPSHDDKKNPLTHRDKVKFIRDMLPGTNVYDKSDVKNPLEMMKHLEKQGHKKVTIVVGEDRVQEFKNLLHKYNGEQYHLDQINVVSAGHRDPDAEGIEGISGTKMREYAKAGDFKSFSKGVPSKKHAKELYMATRKGMKTESYQAMFLLGGPGSGKDALLRETSLGGSKITEIQLNQLHDAILEKKNITSINEGYPIVVNGNADDYNKVLICKNVLESIGYRTAAVFVYTTDEVSRARNDQRIKLGGRSFNEETRSEKYSRAIGALHQLKEQFSGFTIFDNSHNMRTLDEETKETIDNWLSELNDVVESFFVGESSIDEQVATFLEGKESEHSANRQLSQTQRMKLSSGLKTSTAGGQNDYFNHNANKERARTNRVQGDQKIPSPPTSITTGPSGNVREGFKAFRKAAKPTPSPEASADQGNGMTATEEKKPHTKAAKMPTNFADIRAGDGMSSTATLAAESHVCHFDYRGRLGLCKCGAEHVLPKKSLTKIKEDITVKSPDQEFNGPEVYEDWGIEGQEMVFETRVVRTNKPFKTNKGYAVYVTDGTNVNKLEFSRKATTLQENVEQTDIRFWETYR